MSNQKFEKYFLDLKINDSIVCICPIAVVIFSGRSNDSWENPLTITLLVNDHGRKIGNAEVAELYYRDKIRENVL